MSFYKDIKKVRLSEVDRSGGLTREDKPKMYAIYTDGVPAVKYADKAEAETTADELRKEFPTKKVEVRVTEAKGDDAVLNKDNKSNDDYYKFILAKAKTNRPLSKYEQNFVKTYRLYKQVQPVTEQELMEGPEERIKANPAYVNGVMQHLMHDATVPISIEHQIGLRPDPQKIMDVWLKYLDKLNAQGHDGIPMSTNKKYHEWLTKIYAQKATPFEDIDSRAAQALYQHEVMRRRNLLRPEHTDVNRFGSISQLEHVLDRLYREQLRKVLEDEKMKEIIKHSKAVHLVSNDVYDIYVPLNRGAAVKYGKGTRWCTASTNTSNYYDRYSRQGLLYIIMPKGKGDEDKFQFHLESESFMDSADSRASYEAIRRDFPNLKKDVQAGLAAHPELNVTPDQFDSKIQGNDRWYGLRRYFDNIQSNENN